MYVCVCVCVCVCVRACDNVCDIRANDAYAYKCEDIFRDAISASYTSFVSCALF